MSGGARDARGVAVLSAGLLARKGEARPAMRRPDRAGQPDEDLGWNDMGDNDMSDEGAGAPPVVRQQAALARAFVPPAAAVPGRKAAFTLRLDPERHLRLRLACAVRHRSAQQVVIQALDELLARMPEAERLAASLADRGDHLSGGTQDR